ncbi:membrane protein YqaA with SNARE-associated domain [Skermanella aerolata]|uniref:YqaA family protein n=1 Tax=Skermanella aerolata TaxID=393310 RepID=UPI0005CA2644|nr:YqaA family protein [Skermanella aerolata]KJB95214.1 cytochrome B561 [Skermanella aerolata KACC 11604]
MIRPLYDWTMRLAGHRHAMWAMGFISFIESSIFPVPPDALMMPMVLARRDKAWRIATVCTLASVVGGLFGYMIGYFLWDTIGQQVMDFYGYAAKMEEFAALYNEWGFWIVAGAGFTPFPYKVITIASGVTHLDLAVFMVASVVSRGARFFLVAGLLWYFGPPIRVFIEKHLGLLASAFFALLLGGFAAVRYVM